MKGSNFNINNSNTSSNKGTNVNMQLNRRNLLKGLAGAGVLSACQVEKAFAETQAPLRVCYIALQHGWGTGNEALENITGTEFDFQLPSFWSPFEAIKDQCVFIDGLRGTFWGNAHDVSYADILTAGVPIKSPADKDALGGPFAQSFYPSIDYLLEQHHGMEALRLSADYKSFGAAYHHMSFNDRLQSQPYYTSAKSAYDSVFASQASSSATGDSKATLAELFPYLSKGTNEFIERLSPTEQNKLLNYLDASESLQKKLSASAGSTNATEIANPPQEKQALDQELDSYFDMLKVAFSNDSHRVAVLGMGAHNNVFEWSDEAGAPHSGHADYTGDFHHEIAHYKGKPNDAKLAYAAWTRYYAQKVTNFVNSLQQTIDIDGNTLLDNTIIVLTGEVGNGNHNNFHKPHIVIGGGNRLRKGRWFYTPRIESVNIGNRTVDGTYQNINDTTPWAAGMYSQFSHADLHTKIAHLSGLNIPSVGIDALNVQPLDI